MFLRAAQLTDYLIAHTRRAFGLMTRAPEFAMAKRVLDWITSARPRSFATSEVHRAVMKNANSVEEPRAVLRLLALRNYIAKVPAQRKDQERWMVHPQLAQGGDHAAR